ncbi:MAG TPA: hypothetical protein PLA83_02035 [Deltaproteobacteria bacterium]|jgi:hypothetical protein|nr:hypothetical protein [Deltaproteobacteria bacterium]
MRNRHVSFPVIAVLLAAIILSGCSAVRYTATMKPAADKDLQYGPVRLTLSSFNYEKPGVKPLPPDIDRKARELFPSVFTDDLAGLPVHIDIKTTYDNTSTEVTRLLSLAFTLGVIPIPGTEEHGFIVRTSVLDSLGEPLVEKEGKFGIDAVSWASYWPWGLLPVPGHSDLPRTSLFSGYYFASNTEESYTKINDHAAACIAEIAARSLQSADRARLEAAFRDRQSRVQEITIDDRKCTGFLTMMPVARPKAGSTFKVLVYDGEPKQGAKPLHTAVVARYDDSGRWQPVKSYLRHARTLTSVSALIENNVPVRVAVRTPEPPPLEDFIDTPDLSGADRAEILRWSNSILLDAKNRSLDRLLREEGRDALLVMATRIEKSILELNEQAERSKDKAQSLVEKGEGDPAPDRELSILCRQRIEILKPMLAAVKGAAAGMQ